MATTTFFRSEVHISLLCPPSTCACMCAVNAGGCVIDLFVQGCSSTSSLLCLVTGNGANTDNSPVPTSPFCIPPYQAWRVAGGRWKITSDTLTLFRRTAPTGNRTQIASVIGQSVTTRPPLRLTIIRGVFSAENSEADTGGNDSSITAVLVVAAWSISGSSSGIEIKGLADFVDTLSIFDRTTLDGSSLRVTLRVGENRSDTMELLLTASARFVIVTGDKYTFHQPLEFCRGIAESKW